MLRVQVVTESSDSPIYDVPLESTVPSSSADIARTAFDDVPYLAIYSESENHLGTFPPYAAPEAAYQSPPVEENRRPRIWSALVAALLGTIVSPVVSTAVIGALVAYEVARGNSGILTDMHRWLSDFVATRVGLIVMVMPIQLTVLFVALAGALLSRQALNRRLGLVRGHYHFACWTVFALSTPVIGFISSIVFSMFIKNMDEALERIQQLFGNHTGPFMYVVALLIAVVPGFCEEILFRGYVQSRLLTRLPAAAAIIISAAAFSLAHFHPVQSLVVFPLGVWLGILAWRSESIWPSIMGHIVNNASSFLLSQLSMGQENNLAAVLVMLSIAGISGTCLLISCILLWIGPRADPVGEPRVPALG